MFVRAAAAVHWLAVSVQCVRLLQHIRQLGMLAQLAHDSSGAGSAEVLQLGTGVVPAPYSQAPVR